MSDTEDDLPLTVTTVEAVKTPEATVWDVTWHVSNVTNAAIEIGETWLPHSRFRGEREVLGSPLAIPAGESIVLRRFVRCLAEAGETIENAFLILQARVGGHPLRVFTRLRIEFRTADVIDVLVEKATALPIPSLLHGEPDPTARPSSDSV